MKIVKVLLFTLLSFSSIVTTHAAIGGVEAVSTNKIQVTTNNGVQVSETQVEGDFKILKDIEVTFSSKDFNDKKKIIVTLGDNIKTTTTYSLLSVYGVDGNIDFTTNDNVEGFEHSVSLSQNTQGITSIKIIDSRTLELYFNQLIEEEEFEFKIFSEVALSGLEAGTSTVFRVTTAEKLERSSKYIFMVLGLKDFLGTDVQLDEDFFEITTAADLSDASMPDEKSELAKKEEEMKDLELNVAQEDGNMVDVAITGVEETPDTGASTNVLILLTLLINGFLFFRKKFTLK